MNRPPGTFKLFRVQGIDVYLHWAWALVAYFQIKYRYDMYSTPIWAVAEYLTLFGIVLLHEFGHALACRSVGGKANTIMLWPLGGVAFVQAPQRAGAQLWSIIAGPLVNAVLIVPTVALYLWARESLPPGDVREFLFAIAFINIALLIFNMLPIYPLDGGQTLRSLLWFLVGPATSLLIAGWVGIAGAIGLIALAALMQNFFLLIVAVYAAFQAWQGVQGARAWMAWQRIPRHMHVHCPRCGANPPAGAFWVCDLCQQPMDLVASRGQCPNCRKHFDVIVCPDCRAASRVADWFVVAEARSNGW